MSSQSKLPYRHIYTDYGCNCADPSSRRLPVHAGQYFTRGRSTLRRCLRLVTSTSDRPPVPNLTN
jgi:hypothetical protein